MTRIYVSAVDDLEGLRALEGDWRAVHDADPHATVFTGWPWILGRVDALAGPWRVLEARDPAGAIVGLLPLRCASARFGTDAVVTMVGSPRADYTGFVCRPEDQRETLAAFASHLGRDRGWLRLELRDVRDPRLGEFLESFSDPAFRVTHLPPTPCPQAELESDWETFLRLRVHARRRQTLRRQLRNIARLDGVRWTGVEDGPGHGADQQIEHLLGLWQRRWGRRPDAELAEFRSVLRASADAGLLWLEVLWSGATPVAGLAAFLDRPRSRFCFYLSGYDDRFAAWSPGMVVVLRSLQAAIRDGFRVYDFLRGDEDYKYALGAKLAETENVDVERLR